MELDEFILRLQAVLKKHPGLMIWSVRIVATTNTHEPVKLTMDTDYSDALLLQTNKAQEVLDEFEADDDET